MKTELNTTIMHHLFLWVNNWTKEDFKKAFKTSPLGWQYNWDRFKEKLDNIESNINCTSSALINIILNMDDTHQQLLMDYIIKVKYKDSIAFQLDIENQFTEIPTDGSVKDYPEQKPNHNILE